MSGISVVNRCIVCLCILGLQLSYYAYVIETNKEHDEEYVAFCDFSEHMSCSKAFMSEYGKGFGLVRHVLGEDSVFNQPNSVVGILFYCLLAVLCAFNTISAARWQVFLGIVASIGSLYLAFILYFILYDFCVVCVSTYVINFLNLFLAIIKVRRLKFQDKSVSRKKK